MNDEILFLDDNVADANPSHFRYWKVLIVDDDDEIHAITKLVLSDYTFEDRKLKFYDAYSGKEAIDILNKDDDIALVLLDVVMETEDAGLITVMKIRNELTNRRVRIILRTGQPGQAPEMDVIRNYDINDYKEKTELTSQKLLTTVTAALRSYRDIKIIEQNKLGLEQIIKASSQLNETGRLREFVSGVLRQMVSILNLEGHSLYIQASTLALGESNGKFRILAGSGKYENMPSENFMEQLSEELKYRINTSFKEKKSAFYDDCFVGYFTSSNNVKYILYLGGSSKFTDLDKELIKIFSQNVALAFEKMSLSKDLMMAQKELIYILGETVESRSQETSNHVRRVANYSFLMAMLIGLKEDDAEIIKNASPLHDLGKIAISDSILKKKGPLTPEEMAIMKSHTVIGHEILRKSSGEVMRVAAQIAYEHHEKWNGKGYPQGISSDKISIAGRIVCVCDVFDALSTKRSYKKEWSISDVTEYMKKESGVTFDPYLVTVLIKNLDQFLVLKDKFR